MSDYRADLAMAKVPDFERSRTYERVYLDRDGRVFRLQTSDTPSARFTSRERAAVHVRLFGYRREPAHDTMTKFAYSREANI